MMLLVLSSPDIDESLAIDTALHLWYSAFLKDEHMKVIKALPQIVSQRETTEEYSTFRSNKLDITLNQIVWAAMLSYCNERQDFDRNEAQRTRRLELMAAFDLALQRDEYELRLLKHCPGHRVPIERFYDDRILLPFSQSRDLYTVPNPVLFFGRGWHLKRLETPLDGWYLNEIATFETSLASNDIYGKLYCHVKTLLKNLRARLVDKDSKCHLTLLNMDVYLLKKRVRTRFDRIECSNTSDAAYLGLRQTTTHLAPMLKSREENSHASLITLSMVSVANCLRQVRQYNPIKIQRLEEATDQTMAEYLSSRPGFPELDPNPFAQKLKRFLMDKEPFLKLYKMLQSCDELADENEMVLVEEHTIVDRHPCQPKKASSEPGDTEEFWHLAASFARGLETYFEWRRKA